MIWYNLGVMNEKHKRNIKRYVTFLVWRITVTQINHIYRNNHFFFYLKCRHARPLLYPNDISARVFFCFFFFFGIG